MALMCTMGMEGRIRCMGMASALVRLGIYLV
jgi:hypothetical protein